MAGKNSFIAIELVIGSYAHRIRKCLDSDAVVIKEGNPYIGCTKHKANIYI